MASSECFSDRIHDFGGLWSIILCFLPKRTAKLRVIYYAITMYSTAKMHIQAVLYSVWSGACNSPEM